MCIVRKNSLNERERGWEGKKRNEEKWGTEGQNTRPKVQERNKSRGMGCTPRKATRQGREKGLGRLSENRRYGSQ